MGKLIAGMLFVVLGAFAFAGPAGASEAKIPPTDECAEVFATHSDLWINSSIVEEPGNASKRKVRRFANRLAGADCISDAEPLYKKMKPRPNTEQCADAAMAADSYWQPISKPLRRMTSRVNERGRKLTKEFRRLNKRIKKLRKSDAPKKQIKRVQRKQARVLLQTINLAFLYLERAMDVTKPHADASMLTLLELTSLRCVGDKSINVALLGKKELKQPTTRVLRKYRLMIAFSALYLMFGDSDQLAPSSAESRDARVLDQAKAAASSGLTSIDETLSSAIGSVFPVR